MDNTKNNEEKYKKPGAPPMPNIYNPIRKYRIEWKTSWEPPKKDDPDFGAKLLGINNIPQPLHGHGCQPRTIVGSSTWNYMRKECYYKANFRCEICGRGCHGDPDWEQYNAHEIFSVDYVTGEERFVGLTCLCRTCHLTKVHTGRALTLYRKSKPAYNKATLLKGAEEAFPQVHESNKKHPKEKPIRLFYTWLSYLNFPDLKPEMERLIKEYDVSFWRPDPELECEWGDWKLIYNGHSYPTPYKSISEWETAMEENNKRQAAMWDKVYPKSTRSDHVRELKAVLEEIRKKKGLDKTK